MSVRERWPAAAPAMRTGLAATNNVGEQCCDGMNKQRLQQRYRRRRYIVSCLNKQAADRAIARILLRRQILRGPGLPGHFLENEAPGTDRLGPMNVRLRYIRLDRKGSKHNEGDCETRKPRT